MATNAEDIITDSWKKWGGGRQTIAFTSSVAQAHSLARAFNEAGVPAAAADGTTPTDIRRAILDGFKRGEYKVLVNCYLWTEGVDLPEIACVMVVKPTKSDLVYVQMAGRGLRLAPGKTDCLIMDFVPEDARDMLLAGDLLGKTRKQKKAEEKAGQVGLILDVFGISSDGGSIDGIDPDDVRTRVLNYLTAARLAWTYDGKLATAAVGERESVGVVFPDPERIAKAEALRASGVWNESWEETFKKVSGYQVFGINSHAQLIKVAETWDDAVYAAEIWAEDRMTAILSKRASSWRNSPPSDKQAAFAKNLGIWRDGMTRGAVAQAITHELAKRKINNAIRF
jgi:superfamily II DNA/RNA helicase